MVYGGKIVEYVAGCRNGMALVGNDIFKADNQTVQWTCLASGYFGINGMSTLQGFFGINLQKSIEVLVFFNIVEVKLYERNTTNDSPCEVALDLV